MRLDKGTLAVLSVLGGSAVIEPEDHSLQFGYF